MRLLRFARNDTEKRGTKKGTVPFFLEKRGLSPFSEEERILRRIPLEILALSFLVALASLLFFSPLTSVFILGGGAFSALNFIWLKKSVSRIFLPGNAVPKGDSKKRGQSPFFKKGTVPFFYGLRLLLILAIFFIIILLFSKKIIAFAAGFSVIIPVFLAEALIALSRMKQWKI